MIKYIQILLKDTFNPDLRITELFDKQTSDCIYNYLVDRFDIPVYAMDVSKPENYIQVGIGNQTTSYPDFSSIPAKDGNFCMIYTPNPDVIGEYVYQTVYYCDSENCEPTSNTYPWIPYNQSRSIDAGLVSTLCERNFNINGFVLPKYYSELVAMTPQVTYLNVLEGVSVPLKESPSVLSSVKTLADVGGVSLETVGSVTNEAGLWYEVKYHTGKEYIYGFVRYTQDYMSVVDSDPTEVLNYIKPVSSIYKNTYFDRTVMEDVTSYNLTETVISFIIERVITPDSTPEEIAYVRKLFANGAEDGYLWDNELLAQIVNKQISLAQFLPGFVPTGYFDLKTESYMLSILEPEVG